MSDPMPIRLMWLVAGLEETKRREHRSAREAFRNALRRRPSTTWSNGHRLYDLIPITKEPAMEKPEDFKIGPEYLNEALHEAGVEDVEMTLTPEGQLYLDTDLSNIELVNRLISGIALLYSKLFSARRAT